MAVIKLDVDGVTFNQLWDVDVGGIEQRCYKTDEKFEGIRRDNRGIVHRDRMIIEDWGNYCAIKLSDRLIQAGFSMPSKKKSPYAQCNGHGHDHKAHFLRAAEMASWLLRKPVEGLPEVQKAKGSNFDEKFGDKQGIIYFKDYWARAGQTDVTADGDHIDLWYKGRLTTEFRWFRDYVSDSWYNAFNGNFGGTTPLVNSKEVWFWELS